MARLSSPLLVALVALAAAVGCDEGGPAPEPDARCVVSFDGYVYVDAKAPTATVLERVQHQQQSVASTLRRQRISVDARRQGVDVRTLTREPVRVVDPAGGKAVEKVRVRYKLRTLGRAPKASARADFTLGALQNDGARLRDDFAAACVPGGERSADALAAPWKSFDAALPACVDAASKEQRHLTELRAALGSAAEVTSAEIERRYLPVAVRVRPRRPRPKTAPVSRARARTNGSAEPESEPAPTAPAAVSAAATAEPGPDVDPLAEVAAVDDGYDDVAEDRGGPADDAGAGDPTGAPDHAGSKWLEPNYYVLALVAVALVVLLRRKRRP